MRRTTESGKFVVFRGSEAGAPDLFQSRKWYFEPANPHGGDDVYSKAYPTARAALLAAEQWEAEEDAEAAYETWSVQASPYEAWMDEAMRSAHKLQAACDTWMKEATN